MEPENTKLEKEKHLQTTNFWIMLLPFYLRFKLCQSIRVLSQLYHQPCKILAKDPPPKTHPNSPKKEGCWHLILAFKPSEKVWGFQLLVPPKNLRQFHHQQKSLEHPAHLSPPAPPASLDAVLTVPPKDGEGSSFLVFLEGNLLMGKEDEKAEDVECGKDYETIV